MCCIIVAEWNVECGRVIVIINNTKRVRESKSDGWQSAATNDVAHALLWPANAQRRQSNIN